MRKEEWRIHSGLWFINLGPQFQGLHHTICWLSSVGPCTLISISKASILQHMVHPQVTCTPLWVNRQPFLVQHQLPQVAVNLETTKFEVVFLLLFRTCAQMRYVAFKKPCYLQIACFCPECTSLTPEPVLCSLLYHIIWCVTTSEVLPVPLRDGVCS